MFRKVVEVAPIAALLAIGVPQPSTEAMAVPSQRSDDATVLVAERGGESRGDRRGSESRGHRHHRGDNRDRWFGFGRPYDAGDCGWLRRRAIETDSNYWWRRYQDCRGR